VASAGPYASLHLAPNRQPHQHPTTLFFTGQMPFLPPNQQRQSTEGKKSNNNDKHQVVTSEALGPCSVLLRRGKRESPGEEECI